MLIEENANVFVWIALFIVLGGFFYFLDRWFGVSIYRWFYGMTHKEPLPAEEVKGFIHNRKAKIRFANACVLAFFLSLVNYYYNEKANPLYEILSWILEAPLVFIGFCLGPVLYRIWDKKDNLFKAVDKLENGEIDVSGKLKDVAESVTKDIFNVASNTVNQAIDSIKKQDESSNKLATPKQDEENKEDEGKEEEEIDPKELMNKYLNK